MSNNLVMRLLPTYLTIKKQVTCQKAHRLEASISNYKQAYIRVC